MTAFPICASHRKRRPCVECQTAQIQELATKVLRLREGLHRHGQHNLSCALQKKYDPCTCGLNALLDSEPEGRG